MDLSESQLADALSKLNRAFNSQLDKDVLMSVLLMCDGDVNQAINFMRVQNEGDYVEPPSSSSSTGTVPSSYFDQPKGYRKPASSQTSSASLSGNIKQLLLIDSPFTVHLDSQMQHYDTYISVLLLLLNKGVSLSSNTKSRALAAAWHRHDWPLSNHLMLDRPSEFGLLEIIRALRILDGPRKLKDLERKWDRLSKSTSVTSTTLGAVRAKINDLKKDVIGVELQKTSVSGALSRRLCKWVSTFDADQLAFYLIQMPKEPWQELADLIHCKDSDFKLNYFLSVIYGAASPKDSVVTAAAQLTAENALSLIQTYHIPYSFIRKQIPNLTAELQSAIARYEKLETLIWYYEELTNGIPHGQVDNIITERLDAGVIPSFGYGKLMERLLFFKQLGVKFLDRLIPIAEESLRKIRLPLDPPVLVLGDASYSMDVAIRTATIIGSLLTVLASAELKFFNVKVFGPASGAAPRSVVQALDVATTTKADGLTAPACTLWEYYQSKKVIKCFVVVTDEIENEKSKGEFFGQLFYKYYTEVFPAKIVFVSFLTDPSQKGRMVQSLENLGIMPIQFRLDSIRPDLTKVDALLGSLSSECEYFDAQVTSLKKVFAAAAQQELDPAQIFNRVLKHLSSLPMPSGHEEEEKEVDDDRPTKNNKLVTSGKGKEKEKDDIPEEYICPISNDLFQDPVIASDGFVYERVLIESWFAKNLTSPMTGATLTSSTVYPNHSLRSRVREWQDAHKS